MSIIKPYGGTLINPMLYDEELVKKKESINHLPVHFLSSKQLCDIELLLNGGFSPLKGFMNQQDYESVLESMRLKDGPLFPIPITLDIPKSLADKIEDELLLKDPEGAPLAILKVKSKWSPDKMYEAIKVYNTDSIEHPAVNALLNHSQEVYVGGDLIGLELPTQYDHLSLRKSPRELRDFFEKNQLHRMVGFQTRNPMHRAHQELTLLAMKELDADLLIHPAVGMTKPGDIDHYVRVRCYQRILDTYPKAPYLSLLPLAMRMAGPREALWHAIIRQNYGCSHFIIGRDHASPGKDASGKPFYDPYHAQQLAKDYQKELDIHMASFPEIVYLKNQKRFVPLPEVPSNEEVEQISFTDFFKRVQKGLDIPEWFSYPQVVDEIKKHYLPKNKRGFSILLTGFSGAGKSTIAHALLVKLIEIDTRKVSLLDGDVVRKFLSSELGFSKEHRDLNVLRIGYVASEITKCGGIALLAPIAPYEKTRRHVKELIQEYGGFIEVYVSTPLEVCEDRDRKGLYAKAKAGEIENFTGVSDPYEVPINPDVTLDTSKCSLEQSVDLIISKLKELEYL
jgi:sulfate adenylyltransferase